MVNRPFRSFRVSAFLVLLVSASSGCGGDGARVFGGGTGGAATGGDSGGGTGGAMGGGGTVGSGGTTGTGGRTASGGMTGTGGRTASGGMTGTGGRTGTGGIAGSGGRAGTGGSGTGGGPGTGGTGGANPATCDAIAAQYANEMPNAKMCAAASAAIVPQCQTSVASALGCGSTCITYVQNATNLHQIANDWQAAGCNTILRACPLIACINAQPGNCTITAAAPAGMCQNGPPTPTTQ